ncbi:MAG: metal-dependent hydrolase [Chloroflexi bacterium]|nr:metal-dependent hydrolase [Chloroflexota bacterium]
MGDQVEHPAESTSPIPPVTTRLDYRLILLGSMLPDIIDKPLGVWLLRDVISNGRVFGHTLLLALLLTTAGIYLFARWGRTGLLWLSFGSIAHLYLDQMWRNPRTLLWPLYGGGFEKMDLSGLMEGMVTALWTKPHIYIPEIAGAIVLGAFFFNLARRRRLVSFLKTGAAD